MKVLVFSRYDTVGASSRVRYVQYVPFFLSRGISLTFSPLFSNEYVKAIYKGTPIWYLVIMAYVSRFLRLFHSSKYDLILIEKELFPYFPPFIERLLSFMGISYVVDYDDALFHMYDCHSNRIVRQLLSKKIDSVMRNSKIVIAGNNYLAMRAKQAGATNIEIIPTVVDTDLYIPRLKAIVGRTLIVGWIGTPKTSQYLLPLLSIFDELKKVFNVRFIAIGAHRPDFLGTAVEVINWEEKTEVASIQSFDIGIMPLKDSPWEKGKCGYKLIQYMACGLPVVASPVGVNKKMVLPEINGFLAYTKMEWKQKLQVLLQMGPKKRKAMGDAGRDQVVRCYSLKTQAPRFLKVLT